MEDEVFVLNSLINLLCNSVLLTGYITNSNTFPLPLDETEEQMYLDKLKNGDKEAKSILIERNLRLVAHIVKKYSFPNKDVDELISIGTVGLIKAIDSFDSSKGTRLATYASRCIENEILMHLRTNKKTNLDISLNETIGIDKDGSEIVLGDIIAAKQEEFIDIVDKKDTLDKFTTYFSVLEPREKDTLIMRYGLNNTKKYTQKDIAKKLNISRSYVSRLEKRALIKLLREHMKEKP